MPPFTASNTTPQTTTTSTQPENLGSIGLVGSSGLLGTLQYILKGLQKDGKPIQKGIQKCGSWNSFTRGNIEYKLYKDKRVSVSNIETCKSPDCPVCGCSVNTKKTKELSKALQQVRYESGEIVFVTTTTRPMKDVSRGINLIQDFNKRAMKVVNNYTRTFDKEDKGLSYATIEPTFSRKRCYKNEEGNRVSGFYYIHTHSHMIVGLSKIVIDKKGMKPLIDKLKDLWINVVKEHKAYSQVQSGVGFKYEYVDNTDKISTYMTKMMSTTSMSLELTQAQVKKGGGFHLFQLLQKINQEPDTLYSKVHRQNIRDWFKYMYRQNRQKGYGLKTHVEKFKARQKEIIESYVKKTTTGLKAYTEGVLDHMCVSQPLEGDVPRPVKSLKELGWSFYFEEDSWTPSIITKEIIDSETLHAIEVVPPRVYNLLRKLGYEDTLKELFIGYYFDDAYKECYNEFKTLSYRSKVGDIYRFIRTCNSSNLLKGSFNIQQHNKGYTHE